jgi:DNA polymerase-1
MRHDLSEIQDYLQGATLVAFDFETAPLLQYRSDPKASLNPHRAWIVGISLSGAEGSAIYIPLQHFEGGNADPAIVIPYLRDALWMNPNVTKVAHNLAFEAQVLYALGIVLQPPCFTPSPPPTRSRAICFGASVKPLKTLVQNFWG